MSDKVLTLDGVDYTIGPITVDDAEAILEADPPLTAKAQTRALLGASMGIGNDEIGKLPYAHYGKLMLEALEFNGLKVIKGGDVTPGEAQPISPSGPS